MAEWTAESWQAFLDAGGGYGASDFQRRNAWWLRPTPENRKERVGIWSGWFEDNQDFVALGVDVALLIAIIKTKGALIRAAGNYLWMVPAAAYGSALLTILAVEAFVGKKEANELSQWYANAVTDPLAWHVETDRVVQGATQTLIADFSEGVTTSPSVAKGMFEQWYSNHESQLREIGSWL